MFPSSCCEDHCALRILNTEYQTKQKVVNQLSDNPPADVHKIHRNQNTKYHQNWDVQKMVNLLSDSSPAEVHQWQWFRLQPTFRSDFQTQLISLLLICLYIRQIQYTIAAKQFPSTHPGISWWSRSVPIQRRLLGKPAQSFIFGTEILTKRTMCSIL